MRLLEPKSKYNLQFYVDSDVESDVESSESCRCNPILLPLNPATATKMEGLAPTPAYAHDPAISIDIAFGSSAARQLNQYSK
jgi:hypothetical protein